MEADREKPIIPQKGTDHPVLKYLYKHVKADIANNDWYEIGVELFDAGDEAVLNRIKDSNPGDTNKCAAEMLRLWLVRNPKASWNQLLEALREPNIGLNKLATKIEKMLSKDLKSLPSSSAKEVKTTDESDDLKLLPSSSAKKVKITDESDDDRDSLTDHGTYDHSLIDHGKVDFEACDNVSNAFAKLYSRFQIAISALKNDYFYAIKNTCVNQAEDPLRSLLRRASNSHYFFEAFSDNHIYCNWINLDFLEIIANSYVNDSLVNLIKDYKQAIFSKSLREVWSSLPRSSSKFSAYYSELKQKLEGRDPDNMTVQQLLHSEPQLTKKIALLFAVVRVESLLISWLIPTDEVYQAYLSFLTVPQQKRIDKFIQFGNWMAHLPGCALQEEQKRFDYLATLSSSTLLIGYYHGLLLRDTNADSLIGYLCYNGLLSAHEQNVILSGYSSHCRNWLLLEYIRHMDSSSLMIFSKLVKDLWPQIGIQLVTALASYDDKVQKEKKDHVILETNVHFSYIDPSSVLTVFFQVCDSVVELLASCHVEVLFDVCDHLMASDKHFVTYFSDKQIKRLKDCDSSLLLLQRLSLFFTWSNHSILRVLADQCSEAVDILNNFDRRVNSLELIASYPIPCFSSNMIPTDTSTSTILAIRCGQALYECTLKCVYDMQSVMVEKCGITKHCLQLLAVRNNPTILYWTIPECVVHLINANVQIYSEYLHSRGILEVWVYPDLQLTVDDHVSVGLLPFCDNSKLVETKDTHDQENRENIKLLQEAVECLKADKIALKEDLDWLDAKFKKLNINETIEQLYEKIESVELEIDHLKKENLKIQLRENNSKIQDSLNVQLNTAPSEGIGIIGRLRRFTRNLFRPRPPRHDVPEEPEEPDESYDSQLILGDCTDNGYDEHFPVQATDDNAVLVPTDSTVSTVCLLPTTFSVLPTTSKDILDDDRAVLVPTVSTGSTVCLLPTTFSVLPTTSKDILDYDRAVLVLPTVSTVSTIYRLPTTSSVLSTTSKDTDDDRAVLIH